MPSAEELKSAPKTHLILISGDPGSGKTTAALSFPKCYMICGGRKPDLQVKDMGNLVHYECLDSETSVELKAMFQQTDDPTKRNSLLGCLAHVKQLAAAGEIQTLIIDDFTFLANKIQQYIWEFDATKDKNGDIDSRGCYGSLGQRLAYWVNTRINTVASRAGLNLIYTCHLNRENEEQVMKKKLTTDLMPAVPGGYRSKIAGAFGSSLYFEAKAGLDKSQKRIVQYLAHCQPSNALGTKLQAKNSWGLPTPMDLTGDSLYNLVVKATN